LLPLLLGWFGIREFYVFLLLFFSEPVRNLESLSLFFSIFNPVITLEFAAPSSEFALELQGEMAQ